MADYDYSATSTGRPRRRDIEGLRAVAIVLVAGYHAGVPGFKGGYAGVDVFFVISGYLITWLLVDEFASKRSIDLARFYSRRARRLLPALSVVLVVVAAAAALVYAPLEQGRLASTALATAAYVSNLYFARFSTDYGGPDASTNPLLHTWSLSVEEQFYLLWPLLVWLALRSRGTPDATPNRRRLLLWLGVMAGLSFAACLYLTVARQPWAFFLSPTRAWEFAAGAYAVLVPESTSAARKRLGAWMGLAGLAATPLVLETMGGFPAPAALLPVLATVLVLRAGLAQGSSAPARLLSSGPFQQLGRLSYSWYLWHWPVLVIAMALYGPIPLAAKLGLLLLSLGMAEASFRLVEHPLRHHRSLRRPASALRMAAFLAIGTAAIAVGWGLLAERWSHRSSQSPFTATRDAVNPIYGAMDCDVGFFDTGVKACAFGPSGAATRVVLFGDSHAGQWFPAVEALARSRGWRLAVITKSACPPVDAPLYSELMGRTFRECGQWRAAALDRIRAFAPEVVLVSTSIGYEFSPDEWERGTRSVLRDLTAGGAEAILLRDTPAAGFDVLTCQARAAWRASFLPRPACGVRLAAGDDPAFAAQRAAAGRVAGARVIDMNPHVHDAVTRGASVPVFRDAGHLSVPFVAGLAGALGRAIDARPSAP